MGLTAHVGERVKSPTSRKEREKWGTHLSVGGWNIQRLRKVKIPTLRKEREGWGTRRKVKIPTIAKIRLGWGTHLTLLTLVEGTGLSRTGMSAPHEPRHTRIDYHLLLQALQVRN
jgi:hypothetical protein